MTDNIKVSLVVPMYYAEDFVDSLLDNLCGQDFKDLEIICVVDGSPDKTLEKALAYSKKDSRIKVYEQEHKGAGAARNLGLSLAVGKYVMFPDADDVYENNYVGRMYEAIDSNNADMAVCQMYYEDVEKKTYRKYGGYDYLSYA